MEDREEDRALLEEFDLSDSAGATDQATADDVEEKSALQRPRVFLSRNWQKRRTLVLAATCVLSLVILFTLYALVPRRPEPEVDSQLAIPLHSSDHAHRQSTTLSFDWHISSGLRAPDGVEKRVYLVNGEFPGPTIEARSGDRIVVRVHNVLDDEGVALHWHGLRMRGHNNMDGAVGFTQCPIPAGGDMVYDFNIGDDEHGTFWWHGHDGVQRADGLFGGLVVHAPKEKLPGEPAQDALLMIGDWFHQNQSEVLAWYDDASSLGREPVPDSVLVNGRGRYDCSMAVPARPLVCHQIGWNELVPVFQSSEGKTRVRLVNTGTIAGLTIKIDGATMRDVRVDGSFPVTVDATDTIGILYPGEKVDFVVDWHESQANDHPVLSILLDDENFSAQNPALNPHQAFRLFPTARHASDTQRVWPQPVDGEANMLQTSTSATGATPTLPDRAHETLMFYLKTQQLASMGNRPVGFVNHTSWDPQSPPLIAQNRSSWDEHQLLPFIGLSESDPVRVDIVINNLDDGSHPLHLHGNSFYVLSSYRTEGRNSWGSYNPFDGSDPPNGLNLESPVRRDTVSVPRRGHAVLALLLDNPGVWMFHCHMLVHMSTGMAMGLHVGHPDDIDHVAAEDASAAELCRWNGQS